MSPIIRPLGMSTDDEEDAPLSLRCAVSVVSERTREERDAVLLAAAIDLTDDTEPQPAPTAVAPVPLAASVILLLSDSEEEEDAPLAKRPHRAANPPSDEDTPLSYRPRQKAATSRLASGSSTHTFQLPARVSDDEDAPLTARVRTKRQRRPEDSGAGGAAAAGGADGADSSEDEAESRPLASRARGWAAKRAGLGAAAAETKRSDGAAGVGGGAGEEREDDEDSEEGGGDVAGSDGGESEEEEGLAMTTAKAVLACGEAGDHEGVLSCLGVPLSRSSPCESAGVNPTDPTLTPRGSPTAKSLLVTPSHS